MNHTIAALVVALALTVTGFAVLARVPVTGAAGHLALGWALVMAGLAIGVLAALEPTGQP